MKIKEVIESHYQCDMCGAASNSIHIIRECERRHPIIEAQKNCNHSWDYSLNLECGEYVFGHLINRTCNKCNKKEYKQFDPDDVPEEILASIFRAKP